MSTQRTHIHGNIDNVAELAQKLGFMHPNTRNPNPNVSGFMRAMNQALADEENMKQAVVFFGFLLPDDGKDAKL